MAILHKFIYGDSLSVLTEEAEAMHAHLFSGEADNWAASAVVAPRTTGCLFGQYGKRARGALGNRLVIGVALIAIKFAPTSRPGRDLRQVLSQHPPAVGAA